MKSMHRRDAEDAEKGIYIEGNVVHFVGMPCMRTNAIHIFILPCFSSAYSASLR